MRVVESTCHKISLYSRRIISLLPDAVIACRGCIVGISKRWRRNRSGVRVGVEKVSRLWTFSGTVRTNGRAGSAAGLQVVVAMLQRNGSWVRSIMNRSSLGTWVRWYLDCTMMYGPKGFQGMGLVTNPTADRRTWRGEGSCLNGTRRKRGASSSLRATRPVSSVLLT